MFSPLRSKFPVLNRCDKKIMMQLIYCLNRALVEKIEKLKSVISKTVHKFTILLFNKYFVHKLLKRNYISEILRKVRADSAVKKDKIYGFLKIKYSKLLYSVI